MDLTHTGSSHSGKEKDNFLFFSKRNWFTSSYISAVTMLKIKQNVIHSDKNGTQGEFSPSQIPKHDQVIER